MWMRWLMVVMSLSVLFAGMPIGAAERRAPPPPTPRRPSAQQTESTPKSNDDENMEEVIVTGIGPDKDAALRDAWRQAIRQVAGALVDSKQTIENDELVDDLINVHSRGHVKSYDELSAPKPVAGGVEIRIKVKVSRTLLTDELSSRGLTAHKKDVGQAAVDAYNKKRKDMEAAGATKEEMLASAGDFLELALMDFERRMINTLDVSTRGRMKIDATTGTANANVTISINQKKYSEFRKNLDSMLTQILRKPTVVAAKLRVDDDEIVPQAGMNFARELFGDSIGGIAFLLPFRRPQKTSSIEVSWRVYPFDSSHMEIIRKLTHDPGPYNQYFDEKRAPTLIARLVDDSGFEYGNTRIVPPLNWSVSKPYVGNDTKHSLRILPVLGVRSFHWGGLTPGKTLISIPISIPVPDMEIEGNLQLQIDWEFDKTAE